MFKTIPLINRFALTMICLLLPTPTAHGNTPQTNEPRELPPGQTLEREMTGAETHRYTIKLAKDEFFQARVEQKGADVSLKLSDASGNILATMDSLNGKQGPETLSFVAAKPGNFTMEVSGFDTKSEKGNYSIRREAARTATGKDRRRVEAERLFVEGMTAQSAAGQQEVALNKLQEAVKRWEELQDAYLTDLTTLNLFAGRSRSLPALRGNCRPDYRHRQRVWRVREREQKLSRRKISATGPPQRTRRTT